MKNKIAIAGLGWLGKPLALQLQHLGYEVKGSVTTVEKATEIQKSGIEAYALELHEHGLIGEASLLLKDVTALIVMIPPGLRRNTGANYVKKMSHLLEAIKDSGVPNCIFISSTSVYSDAQGHVTEKNIPIPENEAGRQVLQVEQLFYNAPFATTIVRFGGLLGGSRQPVRYLAGRENLSGGNAPINLIHREDCIGILTEIVKQQAYGHIFNAVFPEHPTKQTYYSNKAIELGLTPPQYTPDTQLQYKKVDSVNLGQVLGYSFTGEI